MWALVVLVLMAIPASAVVAQQDKITPGSISTQLAAARTVFISNVNEDDSGLWFLGEGQPYNYLYAAMQSWGRYKVVSSPAESDLVLEIRSLDQQEVIPGKQPPFPNIHHPPTPGEELPTYIHHPELFLTIRDARSNAVLKMYTEYIDKAILPSHRETNFAQAVVALVNDMAKAVNRPLTTFTLPKTISAAPVPSQILTSNKLFLSKPVPDRVHSDPQQDELLYEETYAAIKSWGQYELVSKESAADVIWEATVYDDDLRLTIMDPHTQVVLWRITQEGTHSILRHKQKSFDQAIGMLLNRESSISGKPIFVAGPTPNPIISPSGQVLIPISISTSHAVVKTGSQVQIGVRVSNPSKVGITFQYAASDPLTCFVAVRDATGAMAPATEQGRQLRGEHALPQGQTVTYTLNPGEAQTRECTVSDLYDMSAPGRYSIEVQELDGRPVRSNTVAVTVTP
ncbi:MAG TPA: hypothetical protein VI685_15830 [Candidatus Angelobacter sp.]